jgi:hypothetical protein
MVPSVSSARLGDGSKSRGDAVGVENRVMLLCVCAYPVYPVDQDGGKPKAREVLEQSSVAVARTPELKHPVALHCAGARDIGSDSGQH